MKLPVFTLHSFLVFWTKFHPAHLFRLHNDLFFGISSLHAYSGLSAYSGHYSIFQYGTTENYALMDIGYDLLELFVFVLHEDSARDDINDADWISATCGNLGCRFRRVFGVRLEDHFPDLKKKIISY